MSRLLGLFAWICLILFAQLRCRQVNPAEQGSSVRSQITNLNNSKSKRSDCQSLSPSKAGCCKLSFLAISCMAALGMQSKPLAGRFSCEFPEQHL